MIVEGGDDRHSVIGLMRAYIPWPDAEPEWPVVIDLGKSDSEILATGYITTYLKAPGLESLGVVLDADENPASSRYQRLHDLCQGMFPQIPRELPIDGLIVKNDEGKRLGIWIMPNNESGGSLETFLVQLVPDGDGPLWKHVLDCIHVAIECGAECRECHLDKAKLYTWLAWQDPPGRSPGIALTKKTLDPHSSHAATFVEWFRKLYKL